MECPEAQGKLQLYRSAVTDYQRIQASAIISYASRDPTVENVIEFRIYVSQLMSVVRRIYQRHVLCRGYGTTGVADAEANTRRLWQLVCEARQIFDEASEKYGQLIEMSSDCADRVRGRAALLRAKMIHDKAYEVYLEATRRHVDWIIFGELEEKPIEALRAASGDASVQ